MIIDPFQAETCCSNVSDTLLRTGNENNATSLISNIDCKSICEIKKRMIEKNLVKIKIVPNQVAPAVSTTKIRWRKVLGVL